MSTLAASRPRRAALAAALLAAGLLAAPLRAPTAHAAFASCRSDPIVVLSNGVVLALSTTLDADVAQVQEIRYTLHAPPGVRVVRAISTDGAVGYEERFDFNDNSQGDAPASHAGSVYWVEVRSQTSEGHHTGWATIAGGYASQVGITPALVGLSAFQFNPSAPRGDTGTDAPEPPHDAQNPAALPDTVTAALAAWASSAPWATSASSPPGPADQTLTTSVVL